MPEFNFKKLDAFTQGNSSGNPAGAVYLDSKEAISPAQMQQIATEVKGFINEVGYLFPDDQADFRLRYFSQVREVEFCGHATIAIFNDLLENSLQLFAKPELSFRTNRGISKVYNRLQQGQGVFISAPKPEYSRKTICREQTAAALGIEPQELDANLKVELVNGGLWTLVIPIARLECLLAVQPDFETLKAFCEELGADVVTIFCQQTVHAENRFRSRVFPPTFGYLEDPATGSGNAALGYYLKRHQLWAGEPMQIEQNSSAQAPNIIQLMIEQERLLFGGHAVCKLTGKYWV